MKKICIIFCLLFSVAGCLSCSMKNTGISANEAVENEFRGVWVCTVYRMDYPSAYTRNSQILRNDIDAIVHNAVKYGFNGIIFQVRPAADAFYNSKIFPWSRYLTGTQGQAPDSEFDPLKYIIEKCHQSGLELHAWINPYRVTALASDALTKGHIALTDHEFTVDYEGKLYFNPGVKAVRGIIIEGVKEIVENYEVDAIHFDDYFYPDKNFNDKAAFLNYNNNEFSNIENWRRNNNDLLVKETYEAIKKINPKVKFGLSPPGIWANKSYNILGSETNGFQSYYDIFADSLKWLKNNWIDYIAPQVYWHIGNKAADYAVLLNWWADAVRNTNVKLYMGMACYKAEDITYGTVWQGGDEIERQIILNRNCEQVSGMVFFRYLDVLTKESIKSNAENYFVLNDLLQPDDFDKTQNEEKHDENLNNNFEEEEGGKTPGENENTKNNRFRYLIAAIFNFLLRLLGRITALNLGA